MLARLLVEAQVEIDKPDAGERVALAAAVPQLPPDRQRLLVIVERPLVLVLPGIQTRQVVKDYDFAAAVFGLLRDGQRLLEVLASFLRFPQVGLDIPQADEGAPL